MLPDLWLGTLFIAPTVLVLALMVFYPFITLIRYSLLNFSMLRPDVAPIYVGLGNYIDLLTDKAIWQHFIFTGKFVLATLLIQFVVGIAAAYGFHHDFKGRDILFTISLMPMMFCPIVVGFLWQYMFNSQWGLVNWLSLSGWRREGGLARRSHACSLGGRYCGRLDLDAIRHFARHCCFPRHSPGNLGIRRRSMGPRPPTPSFASRFPCPCRSS